MGKNLLTPKQKQILELASRDEIITKQFFLTGGTALSYFYFEHRFSEDLDFFSEERYNPKRILSWVSSVGDSLKAKKIEQQDLTGQHTFFFYFSRNTKVKVDFSHFPFDHLGTFKKFNSLRVSSIDDIAINKVHAITTRKRARDYLDLYLCIRELKWEVDDIKKNYRLKFGVHLSIEEIITSFVNVVDAKDLPMFIGDFDFKKEVERFFLDYAKNLKKKIVTR
ncbi:nucleotidyl transferase AbiEii/AbiGii toxin family protein [Patescibacteria group bacterium]|nr:nucleotidyl transferase AbiEii/AbiGii toxin family protein [Patescibacteria group bacterium]